MCFRSISITTAIYFERFNRLRELQPRIKPFETHLKNVCFRTHRTGVTQSVCVTVCNFIVNVLDLPFASPVAIYR